MSERWVLSGIPLTNRDGRRRFCYPDAGPMLDLESLSSGKSVPVVNRSDMKCVWELTSELPQPENGCVGLDIRLIREQCSPGADPVAVWARVTLLRFLLGTGLLDKWRDADRPNDIVFETLARFPLPEGIQNFRPDEFADALSKGA
jgi:hypothetical protein